MPNLKEIPILYIVDKAKAQANYQKALPYRTLIKDWFSDNHNASMANNDLYEIDSHFHTNNEKMKMQLDGCVIARIRNNAYKANMLVDIVKKIHRKISIPKSQSSNARNPEDIRQDNWSWPLVMRLMLRENIIGEKTNKATFGALIEHILGNKVKPNSIRRTTRGDYNVISKSNFELSETELDAYKEIFKLFVPLLNPKKLT